MERKSHLDENESFSKFFVPNENPTRLYMKTRKITDLYKDTNNAEESLNVHLLADSIYEFTRRWNKKLARKKNIMKTYWIFIKSRIVCDFFFSSVLHGFFAMNIEDEHNTE